MGVPINSYTLLYLFSAAAHGKGAMTVSFGIFRASLVSGGDRRDRNVTLTIMEIHSVSHWTLFLAGLRRPWPLSCLRVDIECLSINPSGPMCLCVYAEVLNISETNRLCD